MCTDLRLPLPWKFLKQLLIDVPLSRILVTLKKLKEQASSRFELFAVTLELFNSFINC